MEASIVILAYGAEPTLERAVKAVLESRDVDFEVIVVDNGCTSDSVSKVSSLHRITVVRPRENLGFAGGCNAGVAASTGNIVVLVNSDAFVAPDAVAQLVQVARRPEVGIASAQLLLDDDPGRLNSVGNPVHYSGLTWSGGFGEAPADHARERDIASATGAAMASRRRLWERLGGFDEAFFAYLEDTELSLRCWQLGLAVRYVPEAVVRHEYEFSRNDLKFFLLERNRLMLLLTMYQARTLLVLAPMLLVVECAMFVQAIVGGWGRAKVRGWWWMLRHASYVAARRRRIQGMRTHADRELAPLLVGRIQPANVASPPGLGMLNALLSRYWLVSRRCL